MTRPSPSSTRAPGWPLTLARRISDPGQARALPEPGRQRARDASAPVHGASEGRRLAAAVAVQHDVAGEQLLERREVALAGRREEAPRQLLALLGGRLEPGPALLDVAARARRELAGVGLATCRRSRRPPRRGSRTRRAAAGRRAAPGTGSRAARGRPATASRPARPGPRDRPRSVDERLRQPLADVVSRRIRAERSWSIASRVVTVAR